MVFNSVVVEPAPTLPVPGVYVNQRREQSVPGDVF
jgi:hypothetical protein